MDVVQGFTAIPFSPSALDSAAIQGLHKWFPGFAAASSALKPDYGRTVSYVLQERTPMKSVDVCACVAHMENSTGHVTLFVWDGTGQPGQGVHAPPPPQYAR